MGLDLEIYKAKKGTWSIIDDKNNSYEWHIEGLDHDICYGRKTWSIYNFFKLRGKPIEVDPCMNQVFTIDKDAVLDFIKIVKPHIENLRKCIKEREIADQIEDPDYKLPRWVYRQEAKFFIDWEANSGNGDTYQLGRDWEIYAIVRWYDVLIHEDDFDDYDYIISAWY